MAVLLAGLPTSRPRQHRQPPVRVEPGRRDAGQPRDRDRRRRRRARRRRRVDEPRAVGVLKPEKGFPAGPADAALDDARLAHGQPGHARRVDDLARRERREARRHLQHRPRGAGRVRAAQPPAAPTRPGRRGFYDDWVAPGRRDRARPRRGHPRRHARWRSWPSSSRPSSRTARSPPATRRRSTTAPPRCSSPARRERRPRAATRSPGSPAAARSPSTPTSSASARSRPPTGRSARRDRLGRRRRRRAQRGLRRAVAGLPGRVADRPGARERQRRRDRDRAPARRVGRADPGHAGLHAEGDGGSTASRRSASASARAWRSCWRRCDASATTRPRIPRSTTRPTSRRRCATRSSR